MSSSLIITMSWGAKECQQSNHDFFFEHYYVMKSKGMPAKQSWLLLWSLLCHEEQRNASKAIMTSSLIITMSWRAKECQQSNHDFFFDHYYVMKSKGISAKQSWHLLSSLLCHEEQRNVSKAIMTSSFIITMSWRAKECQQSNVMISSFIITMSWRAKECQQSNHDIFFHHYYVMKSKGMSAKQSWLLLSSLLCHEEQRNVSKAIMSSSLIITMSWRAKECQQSNHDIFFHHYYVMKSKGMSAKQSWLLLSSLLCHEEQRNVSKATMTSSFIITMSWRAKECQQSNHDFFFHQYYVLKSKVQVRGFCCISRDYAWRPTAIKMYCVLKILHISWLQHFSEWMKGQSVFMMVFTSEMHCITDHHNIS